MTSILNASKRLAARLGAGVLLAAVSSTGLSAAPAAAAPTTYPGVAIIDIVRYYCNNKSGSGLLNFPVTLSAASTSVVTVNYATRDGSALAPTSYTATSGTLTFNPGVTSQTISVTVFCPPPPPAVGIELYVDLSNAVNATITRATGAGAILAGTKSGGGGSCNPYCGG